MTTDDRCGTYAGYQAHKRRGEKPCERCRTANNEYQRIHRESPAVRRRAYEQQEARQRAMRRLAKAHPEEYAALVAEEIAGVSR